MVRNMKVITIRIPEAILNTIDKIAKEQNMDRSDIIRTLIINGLKEYLIKTAIEKYKNDEITLEKAAEIANIPLSDFIIELKKRNIPHKDDEPIDIIIQTLKKKKILS